MVLPFFSCLFIFCLRTWPLLSLWGALGAWQIYHAVRGMHTGDKEAEYCMHVFLCTCVVAFGLFSSRIPKTSFFFSSLSPPSGSDTRSRFI